MIYFLVYEIHFVLYYVFSIFFIGMKCYANFKQIDSPTNIILNILNKVKDIDCNEKVRPYTQQRPEVVR